MAVMDASIVVAALCPDEREPQALASLGPYLGGAFVPGLWPVEVANVLLTKRCRGILTSADADLLWRTIMEIPVDVHHMDAERLGSTVMALAASHGLTSYDACYLELALRLKLPIATIDKALIRAARAEGITVL